MRMSMRVFLAALLCLSGAQAAASQDVDTQAPETEAPAARGPDTGTRDSLAPETHAPDTLRPSREPDVAFVPTPDSVVTEMLRVARVTGEDFLYDLGSGDGRIVIAAARDFGARGIGVDIDPQRVREAREGARRAGVADRVQFVQGDLFEIDIKDATVVTLYLLRDLNVKLRPTLLRDLKPGTRVVSHAFDMEEWEPDSTLEVESRAVYFWVIPADVRGTWRWSESTRAGALRYRLELTQVFQKVSGTLAVSGGTFNLSDFDLEGDRLSFTATGRLRGDDVTLRFSGRLEGDALTGRVSVEEGPTTGERPWRATRVSTGRGS